MNGWRHSKQRPEPIRLAQQALDDDSLTGGGRACLQQSVADHIVDHRLRQSGKGAQGLPSATNRHRQQNNSLHRPDLRAPLDGLLAIEQGQRWLADPFAQYMRHGKAGANDGGRDLLAPLYRGGQCGAVGDQLGGQQIDQMLEGLGLGQRFGAMGQLAQGKNGSRAER